MSVPAGPDEYGNSPRSRVNTGQVWAGGLATAVVAALITVAGVLISRWLFHVPILAPSHEGAWGNANTAYYALAAACVALAATALMNLLMLATPAATTFLSWILGLATVVAVVYPFSTGAPLSQKAATGVVNLILGIAIISLLTGVAARGYRRVTPRRDAPGQGVPGQPVPPADPRYQGFDDVRTGRYPRQ
jgi:hypothetical protein